MEHPEKTTIASAEKIAERIEKLSEAFYETPESLFKNLAYCMKWLKLTEDELMECFNEAIFTIKKTRITIADVLGDIADRKRTPIYNEKTGETAYKLL